MNQLGDIVAKNEIIIKLKLTLSSSDRNLAPNITKSSTKHCIFC